MSDEHTKSEPKMVKWVNLTRDYYGEGGLVPSGKPFYLPQGEKPPSGSYDEDGKLYSSGAQIFAGTPIVPPQKPQARSLSEMAAQKKSMAADRK